MSTRPVPRRCCANARTATVTIADPGGRAAIGLIAATAPTALPVARAMT